MDRNVFCPRVIYFGFAARLVGGAGAAVSAAINPIALCGVT